MFDLTIARQKYTEFKKYHWNHDLMCWFMWVQEHGEMPIHTSRHVRLRHCVKASTLLRIKYPASRTFSCLRLCSRMSAAHLGTCCLAAWSHVLLQGKRWLMEQSWFFVAGRIVNSILMVAQAEKDETTNQGISNTAVMVAQVLASPELFSV